ncbi:MAG: hypothetical protein JXP73_11000 [Deltaproteobacteria bacterium]|nr:hypothetical protein [Deltaproteobacteria bacterium]
MTRSEMKSIQRLFAGRWGLLVLYVVFLGAYLGASGGRLRQHSMYNHFVYLAEGWLKGRLDMPVPPPNENDWARVEVLKLKDGRTLKGMFGKIGPTDRFYPLRGPSLTIDNDKIASRSSIRYVSFPPFPAVAMLPFVAVAHLKFNDVLFTAIWAATNPVLLFLLLRRLRERGYSKRSVTDDLWLTVMFGVGSVYYFASVIGQVWFTAHVIAVTCVIGYAYASLDAAHPMLAGLCVGLGYATRTPLGFMLPFFLFEAVRATGGWARLARLRQEGLPPGLVAKLVRFAIPSGAVFALLLLHNYLRFEQFTEFGHKYLNIAWQDRIQRWGLVNYHFLSRNLTCALLLLPRILAKYPYIKVSEHGMSMLLTTPALGFCAAPKEKSPLSAGLWLSILTTALPSLLYQNSGFLQFGYRFSLDYIVFFVMLLAVGGRRFTWFFKALVVFGVGVNLFGAIVFDRFGGVFAYNDSFFPHGNN